jgi:hypothetical protein
MSGVSLALRCSYPFRADVDVPEKPTSRSAKIGQGAHKLIEGTLRGEGVCIDLPPAAERDAKAMFRRWHDWWVGIRQPPIRSETKYLLDLGARTATVITTLGEREYGDVGPMQIPGTADGDLVLSDRVRAWDWKTGNPNFVERVEVNEQLRTVGLAASLYHGVPNADVSLLFLGGDRAAEEPEGQPHNLDEMELDAHMHRLRGLMDRLPEAGPTPGPWCDEKWCPLRKTCPANLARKEQIGSAMPEWLAEGDAHV